MTIEQTIIKHYAGKNNMDSAIIERARRRAENPEHLTAKDLSPFDEMHIGGPKATAYLIDTLELQPDMRVLDVGCGIGGPARYVAGSTGAQVTGIDLTPDYKDVGESLNVAIGLGDNPAFVTGSALDMPFENEAFDTVYLIHAGMNIEDKQTLYREIFRVLKPGGVFGLYDIMAGENAAAMIFPMPWADTARTSFLIAPAEIEDLLKEAGFTTAQKESRRDFALEALDKMLAPGAFTGRDEDFHPRARNLRECIQNNACAPWQMTVRK